MGLNYCEEKHVLRRILSFFMNIDIVTNFETVQFT
jgi:hypothetical protein